MIRNTRQKSLNRQGASSNKKKVVAPRGAVKKELNRDLNLSTETEDKQLNSLKVEDPTLIKPQPKHEKSKTSRVHDYEQLPVKIELCKELIDDKNFSFMHEEES